MSKKARIQEIELLRGIAFLAVALQHAIAHYSVAGGVKMEDGVIMTLLLMAAKFAVTVFIFITGMVLFYNYDGPLRYGTFVRKRFSDVLVPYILWSAVYFGLSQHWNFGSPGQWGKWAMMLFTGKNSYHLWYVVMIVQFYALFPAFRMLIRRIMQSAPHRWWTGLLVLTGMAYLVLLYFRPDISRLLTNADIPFLTPFFTDYADRNFVYFIFYFILGAAAGLYPERWRWAVEKGGMVYGPVFLALFGYYTYVVVGSFQTAEGLNVNFNMVSLLHPVMAVFLVSSVFVIYRLALQWTRQAGPRVQRWMSLLGKYSYGTYLVHALMLRFSYSFDAWWFAGRNVALRVLMSFVICVVLSYLLTAFLSYLPFGKWTAGVSSLKKRTSQPKAA